MDRIMLDGIEVYAHGGVTEPERQIGQRYRVSVTLEADLARAAESDDLADTIHYGEVHAAVVGALSERPFNLIEAAAERAARSILRRFPVQAVTIRLEKLLPPIDGVVASAGVEIRRDRWSVPPGEPEQNKAGDDEAD